MMFSRLFSPRNIGNIEIPNRIVMLPMTTGYCEADETAGNRFREFYSARAKGGAGLIIIPFSPMATGTSIEPGIYEERFLPGIKRLTEDLRSHGAKSACQLIISYLISFRDNLAEAVAPSAVMNQIIKVVPRSVTQDEIHFIVKKYGEAALRAREGGFDAVEILVGGGYFLNRFLSPVGNQRTDEYGGSLKNRMRILLEIVACIQQNAGDSFPVGVRLNIEEQMAGGHSIKDSKIVAQVLEKAGVAYINSYTGWHESPIPTVAPFLPKGAFAHLAGAIKSVVNIPVIAANRINDPFIAEEILAKGQADFVGMGRALLADPELPNKTKNNRLKEIIPCLACSNCLGELMRAVLTGVEANVFCAVNPQAGREGESLLRPAVRQKKVLIIGGGPAGLQAAWTAAVRGHKVSLFERETELGGWLKVGCLPPHKEEIRSLYISLALRAKRAGAEIFLNQEVGPQIVEEKKPDVLILACGAKPFFPDIPGINLPIVFSAEEIIAKKKTVRGAVVIIGGGLVGCETAEFLIENNKGVTSVTVLEMMERMATNISMTYRPFFMARLKKMGIRMETQTIVVEIVNNGVKVQRKGVPEFIQAGAVIIAVGLKTDPNIAERFIGLANEIYAIGDCVHPRMIKDAMEEGLAVGIRI